MAFPQVVALLITKLPEVWAFAFTFTLRTFATMGHPPAGLALEVTGQAQTRRGCLILHRQVELPTIRR